MCWARSVLTKASCPTAPLRRSTKSAASSVLSCRPSRAAPLAARIAIGAATRAVTSTDARATRQVTATARAVSEPKTLRIGGVADAAYGADQAAVPAEFGAYLGDVYVDRTGTGMRRVPPDRGEQLLPAVHPAGPAHEVGEQVELGRREADRGVTGPHGAPLDVQGDRADLPHPGALGRPGGGRSTALIRATSSRGLNGLVR